MIVDGTVWRSWGATGPGSPVRLDVARFVERPSPWPACLGLDVAKAKSNVTVWSAARFVGNERQAEPLLIGAVVLDFDHPQDKPGDFFALVARALPGAQWGAHATVSSAPGAWRFRLIVPLPMPVEPLTHGLLSTHVRSAIWQARWGERDLPRSERADMTGWADASEVCNGPRACHIVPMVAPCGAYVAHVQSGDRLPFAVALEEERRALELQGSPYALRVAEQRQRAAGLEVAA